jgi:hypothetical protein
MRITLTPRGEELLRIAVESHPDESATEIVERALAERIAREQAVSRPSRKPTLEELRTWFDEFAAFSEKIPPMPGETFSRDMIYRDHD